MTGQTRSVGRGDITLSHDGTPFFQVEGTTISQLSVGWHASQLLKLRFPNRTHLTVTVVGAGPTARACIMALEHDWRLATATPHSSAR